MSNFTCEKCGATILDGGKGIGYTTGCEHWPLEPHPEMNCDWTECESMLPSFKWYGFQTGKLVQVKLDDGTQRKVIYQGHGIFGDGAGLEGVTHWRPN